MNSPFHILRTSLARRASVVLLVACAPALLHAQNSNSNGTSDTETSRAKATVEAAGSGTSLETSESLFQVAVALNACGYDDGLDRSAAVRQAVRHDVEQAVAANANAQAIEARMCRFVAQHRLSDAAQNIAQYVYLALYTTPPPEMELTISQSEMLPSAAAIIDFLPLVRSFAEATQLHLIWVGHRPEYEALLAQVHDPLTSMILNTNSYLRLPVSNYDGRRFVVLMEPMLAPSQATSLLYDVNYFVVASPQVGAQVGSPATIRLDDIRHTYLHYQVEPLIYARNSTLDPFLPLLRHEQLAPVDFVYKTDIAALLTECLIKAAEIHMMDTGIKEPVRPDAHGDRVAFERYNNAMNAYDRDSEAVRRARLDRDMHEGWVVTQYFYNGLTELNRQHTSLPEGMGPMLFGMEIEQEREREARVVFYQQASPDVVRHAQPAALRGMDLADSKLLTDPAAAVKMAEDVMKDPNGEHGRAEYLLGRAALMQGSPEEAVNYFTTSLKDAKDTHTLAMDHIYLGRLYDIETPPERDKAIGEYQQALNIRDPHADTRAAAEAGLKKPFALPRRSQQPAEDGPIDPTGKAEKDAYKPPTPSR